MIEKIEEIVKRQVEAIRNLKIDKITVWDSASGNGRGSSTANFVSSLVKSVPPLQDIASMAGVELPAYLGKIVDTEKSAPPETAESGLQASAAQKPAPPETTESGPQEKGKID